MENLSYDRGTAQQKPVPAQHDTPCRNMQLTCCAIKIHIRSETRLLSMFWQAQLDSKLLSKAAFDIVIET